MAIPARQKLAATTLLLSVVLSCAPAIRSTSVKRPTSRQLAELWVEPRDLASRDLFHGSGGKNLIPRPAASYKLDKKDTRGFSVTYDLTDDGGQEWSVKIGPEAQTEVVSSRLVWAAGFHQPPSYFVSKWTYKGAETAPVPGRFRPKQASLKSDGFWSWQQNPFVNAPQYRGLIVLMMMLNSTDLKNDNNAIYELSSERGGVRRWYVVKDLGATLGETGRFSPRRNWIEGFERHAFITGVKNGFVQFEFRGRHQELLDRITPADVKWTADRMRRLSDKQWHDAFRAGGYAPPIAERFIARLREKIRQGEALDSGQ